MGTSYNIKYTPADGTPKQAAIHQHVSDILEKVNAQMSTYREDSQLSEFNHAVANHPVSIDPEVKTVIEHAILLHDLTQGALDVTVGPLVNLWGFGPEGRPNIVPPAEKIRQRSNMTGLSHLKIDGLQLTKDIDALYVDLSTIAKGWAVDQVAEYLESQSIENYMVEIGGEIRLKGHNENKQLWRIAIEKPVADQRAVQEIISPAQSAIATSGDYRNYFEQNGIRYSHIIDPKTAHPINNKIVSVTVLHSSCMMADGFATGIMVMGEEAGMALAEREKIAVMMIVKTEDSFKTIESTRYKEMKL